MKKIFSVILFLFLAVAIAFPCMAETPRDRVKAVNDKVISVIADAGSAVEKEELIRGVMNDSFDFPAMAQEAISDYWDKRTVAEREEFTSLFTDMIVAHFLFNFYKFSGDGGELRYVGEHVAGDFAIVKTELTKVGKGTRLVTALDFVLDKKAGKWLIKDFSFTNVSTVKTYGEMISNNIRKKGFGEVIKQLNTILRPPIPKQ